ncbi:ROK family transcriptional regulator [Microbacterium sp. KR10-403]|uniref:ROK family transcriptional regulator n=1 Tax=Microbacterium sp. KR10-403 TaxID=3158581 RepID=UPI0032E36B71
MPSRTSSPETDSLAGIRRASLNRVLRAVDRTPGLSQSEIAAETGLAMGAVSSVVGELLDAGIVIDDPERAQRGRGRPKRAIILARTSADLVGVTVTRTAVTARSTTLAGEVVADAAHRFTEVPTIEEAAGVIVTLVERVCAGATDRPPRISISIPGATLPVGFGALELNWSPADPTVILDALTSRGWPVPVIGNDGSFATLAEWAGGDAPHVGNTVVILLSRGLGGSAMVNGSLLLGAEDAPGFGHTPLDPHGPPCSCGLSGCAELAVSLVHFAVKLGDAERFDAMTAAEYAAELASRADAGDAAVMRVLEDGRRSLHRLGDIVSSLLNPERVLLTGEGMRLASWLLPGPVGNIGVPTATGRYGDDAVLEGTIRASRDRFFADPLGTLTAVGA